MNDQNISLGADLSKSKEVTFSESDLVAGHFTNRGNRGTMIDVGAHHGSVFTFYAKNNWVVHAVEPLRKFADALRKKWNKADNVTIHHTAIDNIKRDNVPLFTSDESDGITTLKAFRDTHTVEEYTSTTPLATLIDSFSITEVNFLKIDAEGYDLRVLESFPWSTHQPEVILCEFEDHKTTPLGYTTQELADYLVSKGYHILVSEWEPIIRYGTSHTWRRLFRYDPELLDHRCWGNLIALQNEEDLDTLSTNAKRYVHEKKNPICIQDGNNLLTRPSKNKGILLFGASKRAEQVMPTIEGHTLKILAIADNSEVKQGKRLAGYPIISPEEIRQHPAAPILITSSYDEEIYQELIQLGISHCQIYTSAHI